MRRLLVGCVVLTITLGAGGAYAAEDEPPAAGSFSPTGSLGDSRAWHSATLLPDGRVFVVGGEGVHHVVLDDDGDPEAVYLLHHTAEAWDPATGSFAPAGSHAFSHGWDPALLLPDGHVVIVGVSIINAPRAPAEFWDPETASFSPAGTFEEVVLGGTRTMLPDGRVLFVGGGIGEEDPVATAQIWDPVTGAVSPTGPPLRPRVGHTATLLPDGFVLIVGGGGPFGSDTASAELWDPASGTFSPAGSLADRLRIYHTATLLSDGRVLIVGGTGSDGHLASAEFWDPATATFGPTGSLAEARGGQDTTHTATLLPDGRVLIVGGFGIDGSLASAEVWDPATDSFGTAGSLAQARGDHTATLLPDGRVLIVGGRGVEDEFFASAELWEPAGA